MSAETTSETDGADRPTVGQKNNISSQGGGGGGRGGHLPKPAKKCFRDDTPKDKAVAPPPSKRKTA